MDFWTQHADELQTALLANPQALALHYLRTASSEAVAELVSDGLPFGGVTRDSIIAVAAARFKQPVPDGAEASDFWTQHADELQTALLANPQALALHYLRTASSEAVAELVNDGLPFGGATRDSIIAVAAARAKQPISAVAAA